MTILLLLAAGWIVLLGMQSMASLIVPVFLALNLMIAVQPLVTVLTRAGLPRIVGSVIGMLVVLAALLAFFALVGWTVMQLILCDKRRHTLNEY